MKRTELICLAFTLALLLGCCRCSTYVRYRYGISKPGAETRGSLVSFLEVNSFPQEDQYWFPDAGTFRMALKDSLFRVSILSYMIFDRHGRLLVKDTAACQWSGADVLRNLRPDSAYRVIDNPGLYRLVEKAVPVCRGLEGIPDTSGFDFTFVAIWAKYLGKYNYRLFNLKEFIDSNHSARIRIMWLNADYQKTWVGSDQEPLIIEPGPGWK